MVSEQLLNVMKMFGETSMYEEFTTSVEITNVINQLSQGQLNTNREKYVLSCLLTSVEDALETALQKASEQNIKADLSLLQVELAQLQLTLLSPEEAQH